MNSSFILVVHAFCMRVKGGCGVSFFHNAWVSLP